MELLRLKITLLRYVTVSYFFVGRADFLCALKFLLLLFIFCRSLSFDTLHFCSLLFCQKIPFNSILSLCVCVYSILLFQFCIVHSLSVLLFSCRLHNSSALLNKNSMNMNYSNNVERKKNRSEYEKQNGNNLKILEFFFVLRIFMN